MEHSVVFEEQVSLNPNDFSKEITSINDMLLQKLKGRLENKCSRNGFVLADSLKVLSRSLGKASNGRFIGDYNFYVQLQGSVLNPPDGIVIEGEVISKNKMGLYMNYKNAIRVIVPRDLHIGNEEFDSVNVGNVIKVEIKKSRFQVNDDSILSVGLFVEKNGDVQVEEEDVDEITLAPAAADDVAIDDAAETDIEQDEELILEENE
jgi:DNA-directed RNA polymerase subunit E'/Rpb7